MDQHTWTPESIMQKVAGGKQYTLLHLLHGKPLPAETAQVNQLQLEHLAHLFTLEQQGNISVYGPVLNNPRLQGIVIFNTNDHEAIAMLMATDPCIKAGYLRYELFDFYGIPGQELV